MEPPASVSNVLRRTDRLSLVPVYCIAGVKGSSAYLSFWPSSASSTRFLSPAALHTPFRCTPKARKAAFFWTAVASVLVRCSWNPLRNIFTTAEHLLSQEQCSARVLILNVPDLPIPLD